MSSTTVRISSNAREILRKLAAETGEPMQMLIEEAIEAYRRQRFLDDTNAAFAALRKNPKRWKAELGERKAWDRTLADDLKGA